MVLHLHHVPGRLRVCLANLRGVSRAIVPLHSELLSLPGVEAASISPQTGSVTIYYRRNAFDLEIFWATLRRLGYLGEATHAEPVASARVNAVDAFGEALGAALVNYVVDRSALSLIRLLA
jgi:hypothetical protein